MTAGLVIRSVTSDLGGEEVVIQLPVPSARTPFWLGMHEKWKYVGRGDRLDFEQCGLRLYLADPHRTASQILRLEWAAPVKIAQGGRAYPGAHAGQPHWHIDRAALFDAERHERLFQTLASLDPGTPPLEEFDPLRGVDLDRLGFDRAGYDCSWLPQVHFPAHAGWMDKSWDGRAAPGPQQSSPADLTALVRWWNGSLLYVLAELRAHSVFPAPVRTA